MLLRSSKLLQVSCRLSLCSGTLTTSPSCNGQGRRGRKSSLPFSSELTNPVSAALGISPDMKPGVGRIVDKRPVRVRVKKYHVYNWCGCGMSMNQPFCDYSHRNKLIKNLVNAGPVTYVAPKDGEVWFCNCKQTKHRPFCDGTHRCEEVQSANVDGKFELWEPRNLDNNGKGNNK